MILIVSVAKISHNKINLVKVGNKEYHKQHIAQNPAAPITDSTTSITPFSLIVIQNFLFPTFLWGVTTLRNRRD